MSELESVSGARIEAQTEHLVVAGIGSSLCIAGERRG